MAAADPPWREGQGSLLLRGEPVLARQRCVLVAARRDQIEQLRTAAQEGVSREEGPPLLPFPHQHRPVRRRLVRAPHDIDSGLAEAGSVRPQELLEPPGRGEGLDEVGVALRRAAEEARGLPQAPGCCLAVDGPAVTAPALGIEQVDVQRPPGLVQKQVPAVDGEILEERREGERHFGPHPAADQRDVAPAPVDLAEDAEAASVGGAHEDEPPHGQGRRQPARFGLGQRHRTVFRQITAQVGAARLADEIHLQPLLPLNPAQLFQLPAQDGGALRQIPPPVVGEEEEALPRPRRLQTARHVPRLGEQRPDGAVDRFVDAEEGEAPQWAPRAPGTAGREPGAPGGAPGRSRHPRAGSGSGLVPRPPRRSRSRGGRLPSPPERR